MWCKHTMEILLSHKKNKIMPSAASWMDLEGIMLSEKSQIERQILYDITCMHIADLEKILMLGKIESKEKGATEDGMVGWHHRFNGHKLGQTLGDSEGQGSLACCSPWGHRESDTTW